MIPKSLIFDTGKFCNHLSHQSRLVSGLVSLIHLRGAVWIPTTSSQMCTCVVSGLLWERLARPKWLASAVVAYGMWQVELLACDFHRAWLFLSMIANPSASVQTLWLWLLWQDHNAWASGVGRCSRTVCGVCILWEQGLAGCSPWAAFGCHLFLQSSVGAQPACLHTARGCFCTVRPKLSSHGKVRITHEAWNICVLAFYRRYLLTPYSV